MTTIALISDTHGLHRKLRVPNADILIHAGDFSHAQGSLAQVAGFNDWLGALPHRHRVVIAGNHDFPLEQKPQCRRLFTNAIYLQDEAVTIEGFKIYGSPWQPEFFNWAFNLPRCGSSLAACWEAIPDDTDILVTHGPPFGINDRTANNGRGAGCELLRNRVEELSNLKLHVFGHIHEAYGQTRVGENGPLFVNASSLDLRYQLVNEPVVVEL